MERMSRRRNPRASWHREQIKAAVRMRGETLTSLALSNGLAEDACRDALRTRRPEAEAVIAKFIGIPVEDLWPTRYGRSSTKVDTPSRGSTHRQIVEAV